MSSLDDRATPTIPVHEHSDSVAYRSESDNLENESQTSKALRCIDCADPVDALDHNGDFTRVIAAGSRGVLRVFRVTDDALDMEVDLRAMRSRRKLNLLYSPSNVAWSKLNESLVATTSTNGAVVLWNLENVKQDHHYEAHKRSATTVCFHSYEPQLLVSGSKDAAVFLYDIREQEPATKFISGCFDTIRDVVFCSNFDQRHLFACADDSGTVRFWDMRRSDKPYVQFHAHNGYVSSVAFGPGSRHLLATGGGRDKLIKVWDWSRAPHDQPLYTVETMAPVGRVYWRPVGNCTQVASCAVVNDTAIHIWDIRRPFLPYADFIEHRDSATALAFNPHALHRFVSAGKDGMLILHQFKDAVLPVRHANDVAIDTAPDGLVSIAVNSLVREKKQEELRHQPDNKFPLKPRPPLYTRFPYDAFRGPTQSVLRAGQPERAASSLSPQLLVRLAKLSLN